MWGGTAFSPVVGHKSDAAFTPYPIILLLNISEASEASEAREAVTMNILPSTIPTNGGEGAVAVACCFSSTLAQFSSPREGEKRGEDTSSFDEREPCLITSTYQLYIFIT